MTRLFLAPLLVLTACAAPPTAGTDCEVAVAAVETCTGAPVEESPYSAECTGQEALHAMELRDELDRNGCEGEAPPVTGKADIFCSGGRWDPLGLCSNPAPLGDEPNGDPARYPIVLAHGFNTTVDNFWRFHDDIIDGLQEDQHIVVAGDVPAFNTPQVRAAALAEQVDALIEQGHERVNLVCFSMGGIDCRYLVSPSGYCAEEGRCEGFSDYGERVASVTLISAPNRGTLIADTIVGALAAGDTIGVGTGARVLIDLIGIGASRLYGQDGADVTVVGALEALSEAGMADFNERYQDHPDIYYQSWASASYTAGLALPGWRGRLEEACEGRVLTNDFERDVMFPAFVPTSPIVGHGTDLRPHDGVSTVESARWGEFQGCIPADHLDVVGQINDFRPNRRTGWDYVRFYRNLAFDLAERGY